MSRFEWIKKWFSFLYNKFVNPLFYSNGSKCHQLKDCENNVQSERATLNRGARATPNRGEGEDTTDFVMGDDLKNSLEKVSRAIYEKFVSDWHSPPEELQNQPLYKEINSGIQSVFLNLKSKTHPLEEYEIIISIATGLIAHFKNSRGKKVNYRFKTRQEEVNFLRKHIKCLLNYWLPESMQRSQLVYVFITEILSVNVLEQMINNFSEFTYINETIVAALDHEPATPQKEDPSICDEMNQDISCSSPDESCTVMESPSIIPRKQKRKRIRRIKNTFKGLFKRIGLGKPEFEDVPEFRSYCTPVGLHDVADMGRYDDSEDYENSMTSLIDTSLQMWLQNNWTAKVSERLAEKDGYEIAVYDENAPGTVLWNTKRCVEDFKFIYEEIYQKYPNFIKLETTRGSKSYVDRQFFHSIGTTPDEFINILLNLIKEHQETHAVFFFTPFEYDDEVEELFSDNDDDFSEQFSKDDGSTGDSSNSGMHFDDNGIRFRACEVQSEEEELNKDKKSSSSDLQDTFSVSANRNKSKKDGRKEGDSKDFYQPDGKNWLQSKTKHKKYKRAFRSELEDLPNTNVTRNEECPSENSDKRTESFNIQQDPQMILDSVSLNTLKLTQKGLDLTGQNIPQTMEQRKQKLQDTLLGVLYQLIDEIFGGGKSRVCFLYRIGVLKNLNKYILNRIPNIYAEEQIIWYFNQVAELLTSQVPLQQMTPDVLQSKALELLNNEVQGLLTNYFLKTFFKKQIMNNLKASHQALQDTLANKETIYGLLEDLTKIITNEVSIPVH